MPHKTDDARREYQKKWRKENPEKYMELQAKAKKKRIFKKKKWLVEAKGGSCIRCGYKKNLAALEFHHSGNKDSNLMIHNASWSKVKEWAVDESILLLCSNCHREVHNARFESWEDT